MIIIIKIIIKITVEWKASFIKDSYCFDIFVIPSLVRNQVSKYTWG